MSLSRLVLSLPYRAGLLLHRAMRRAKPRWRGHVPVILIGNITMGGTGKTPMTIFLARRLLSLGWRPAVVSRGYRGRRKRDPLAVSDGRKLLASVAQAGEEARLLGLSLPGVPVLVGRDRLPACRMALSRFGANALLLDDAFQQRERFPGAYAIALVNAGQRFESNALPPAGTLREPVSALRDAHAIIVTHGFPRPLARTIGRLAPGALLLRARHTLTGFRDLAAKGRLGPRAVRGKSVMALSAIGHPAGLSRLLLKQAGAGRVRSMAMPDHYSWNAPAVVRALSQASRQGCEAVVTTMKDAVKMPVLRGAKPPFYAAEIDMVLPAGDERRLISRLSAYGGLFRN